MTFQNKNLLLAMSFLWVFSCNVYANPEGENVVSGSATFDRSTPNTLTVDTATNRTIINYESFGIASNEATVFNQPNANSVVLNRVIGVDPSQIYGTLSSNGKLFLVNPNGILFGADAKVNAPALLASTLDISNDDFLNDRYNFYNTGKDSYIINEGRLAALPGGYVALLSQAVNNKGAIIAPLGTVALAAGDQMTLALDSNSQISVAVNDAVKNEVIGPDGQPTKSAVENSGKIKANGGKVLLTGKVMNDVFDNAINNSGIVEANSMHSHDGVVDFSASGAQVNNSGNIRGGQITITDTDSSSTKGIYSTGSFIASNQLTLLSDEDIYSLGTLESSSLKERGNTFQVGGIFNPGQADVKNADNAIVYAANTSVAGSITDPANIVVDPSVVLTMTADTSFSAGGAFMMDPTSSIWGNEYNLSIAAVNSSTLGNIDNVNKLTLSLTSGSTPVTFTSNSSSVFNVNILKTNYLANLSRSVGTGTAINPIMIYSDSNAPGGLEYIATSGLGLYYQQANNIDAGETSSWSSGSGFTPIGNSSTAFTGSFNGKNYTISSLFIDQPTTDDIGLFGVASGATIQNVGLINENITGQNSVGGLAGGINGSTITNTFVMGSVSGYSYVGGLVGDMGVIGNSSSITNSYTAGMVSGAYDVTGGLVGASVDSSISDSYSAAAITGGTSGYTGGLVGYNDWGATISDSYATGNVSGSGAIGGLAGVSSNAGIDSSYATGDVAGAAGAVVGGLVGYNYGGLGVSNSYAAGAVTAGSGSYIGGLIGENYLSSVSNSYATGSVAATSSEVGGLTGLDYASTISNSFATGAVSGSSSLLGGVSGYNDGGSSIYTDDWWYSGQTYGIGNSGTAQSTGNWQKASGVSDFYGTGTGVGSLYSTWTFGSGGWVSFASTYPHLYYEWSPTITTLLQLQNINLDLSSSYTLGNNIDAFGTLGWNSGTGFTPIGNSGNPFTGTFDGNSYTISNLFIDLSTTDDVGLFGYASGAMIQYVGLVNENVTGQNDVGGLSGGISSSTITNTFVMGSVSGHMYVGGLIGDMGGIGSSSSITNSYTAGSVGGYGVIGGFAGASVDSSISDSYSTADAIGGVGGTIGGLVGYNDWGATISDSYATGDVSGSGAIGGLVGESADAAIDSSYAMGDVTATAGAAAGGLVGYNYGGLGVTNSYATGAVSAGSASYIGGLVGENYLSSVSNSYETGSVTAPSSNLGGLSGLDYSSTTSNSYATGTVSGSGSLGGLLGYDDGGNIYTNNWWYNSQTYGIGNNGTAQSTGNWQKASGVSDFYGTGTGVGSLYSTWTFGSGGWVSFASTYPHLYYEWSPTITTLLQLQNINLDLSSSYTLGNNIDAFGTLGWNSGTGFTPIGNSGNPFTGTFDGNSYTISNLFIDLSTTDDIGLFGVASGATIQNVGLINENITGQNSVGGLAGGINGSTITNTFVMGSVSGYSYVGGLVGDMGVIGNSSSITNSYTAGMVSGAYDVTGGLVGASVDSSISDSYSAAAITGGTSGYTGGLVGYNDWGATISDSYATGNVSGSGAIGGLAGVSSNAGIDSSYATGDVAGAAGAVVGGLVGYNYGGLGVSNSYAAGAVTAGSGSYIGGLIGENYLSSVFNSYATGAVTAASSDVGGLSGLDYSSTTSNSYATGAVNGSGSLGGLLGYDDGGNIYTNDWWYSSQTYGIGNNGTAQSMGNWQMASGASDFYNSAFAVYTGSSPWNFTSIWFTPSSAYPLLR